MANKIIHDSGSWASIWIVEVDLGVAAGAEATLPGGSLAGAINQIVKIGTQVGIILDTPYLGRDGKYHASIDTAAVVRVTGVSGTATDKQAVYLTSGNAVTLTVGTNVLIGYAQQAKLATGDDLYVHLVPTARA